MVVTTSPVLNLRPSSSRPKTRLGNQLAQEHSIQWRTASPLWPAAANNGELSRPEILRFTTDTFMEDFLKVATQAPERLGEWSVTPETWRLPAPVPPLPPASPALPSAETDPDVKALADEPIKLFQSAHQRYYLVTANLVCRVPGFPDRMLRTNNDEQVSFVLRRFLSPEKDTPTQEHALVDGEWQLLSAEERLQYLPGEQSFPMFPTTYTQANGYQRRLFSGLIPVSARETYMNAARREQPAPATADTDAETILANKIEQLMTVLAIDVIQPWRGINQQRIIQTAKLRESYADIESESEAATAVNDARDSFQTSSWYILLDFAYFLKRYCPKLWEQIEDSPDDNPPSNLPGRSLLQALQAATYEPYPDGYGPVNEFVKTFLGLDAADETEDAVSLAKALQAVYAERENLEKETGTYSEGVSSNIAGNWPATRFLLCGRTGLPLVSTFDSNSNLVGAGTLEDLVRTALEEDTSALGKRIPLLPISQQISATAQDDDYQNDRFAIRCVFQRPHCPPSLQPTVVSQRTQFFQMASYFDPDAPTRPIRIPMPVDTSPAGLRKFAKNTAFVLSDSLSCQIEKTKSLTFGDLVLSVLPWPFRKKLKTSGASCSQNKGLDIGKICTLSIPIITICALILLMIIVQLLDIIFRWVPYLIFCLPLPGLNSKGGDE